MPEGAAGFKTRRGATLRDNRQYKTDKPQNFFPETMFSTVRVMILMSRKME